MIAVYPGSFDPVTLGHLDIVERAASLFDKLYVAVAASSRHKGYLFDVSDRVEMVRRAVAGVEGVEVVSFDCLLTDFARSVGARVLVRGLRAISDFEYEFQMALINKSMAPELETVFMMTRTRYSFLSSSLVKELASYGGDISGLVPSEVLPMIEERLRKS